MPEKYLRREGLPLLLRHTGRTMLPEHPPEVTPGVTILCLHDAGLQSSIFSELMAAMGESSTALSFDLPGHGRSGGLDALDTIEEMAEMARWVADWCRIERPLLVGHGMGALVALEWARSDIESVAGLILCGAGRILGVEDEAIETMRRVTRGKAPRPFDPSRLAKDSGRELMKRAYMEGIQTDPRATLVDLEASRHWCDASIDATGIGCPTRFVDGAGESERARARTGEFADSLQDAVFAEIEGAAHYLPFEKSRELAEQIQQVAASL